MRGGWGSCTLANMYKSCMQNAKRNPICALIVFDLIQMFKMIAIANLLLLVGMVTMVAGQAPGDEDAYCTVILPALGRNVVEDPPNGRILMDSSHYNTLLPLSSGTIVLLSLDGNPCTNSDPVWQEVDLDDNNLPGIQSSVSNCSDKHNL